MLSLDAVTIASTGREPRLQALSLSVRPGEFLAVLGPNGAGKSTLVGALAGSLAPSGGRVTLDGRPLDAFALPDLARRRAVLAQDNALAFDFRVQEVVALGRGPHAGCGLAVDRAAVHRAMQRVDALGLTGRSYTGLSGGERQRVHLARALAQLDRADRAGDNVRGPARYLLLDEPTAALDPAHQHATLQLVADLCHERGIGVLAVLHDANLAALYADKVAIVQRGRLRHAGAPSQVLTEQMFRDVFASRVDVHPHPHHPHRPLIIASRARRTASATCPARPTERHPGP